MHLGHWCPFYYYFYINSYMFLNIYIHLILKTNYWFLFVNLLIILMHAFRSLVSILLLLFLHSFLHFFKYTHSFYSKDKLLIFIHNLLIILMYAFRSMVSILLKQFLTFILTFKKKISKFICTVLIISLSPSYINVLKHGCIHSKPEFHVSIIKEERLQYVLI